MDAQELIKYAILPGLYFLFKAVRNLERRVSRLEIKLKINPPAVEDHEPELPKL